MLQSDQLRYNSYYLFNKCIPFSCCLFSYRWTDDVATWLHNKEVADVTDVLTSL